MAESARSRPVEFYNPRPLILGVCFLWGILMGFAINFFRSTDEAMPPAAGVNAIAPTEQTAPSEMERRYENTPNIAEVEPGPTITPSFRPSLENMNIEPPPPLVTTEGGLTGKTAAPLGSQNRASAVNNRDRPSGLTAPPPIPELMP